MRTQLLNILEFASGAAANTPLMVLYFSRSQFEDWRATTRALITDAGAFQGNRGDYAVLMTEDQHAKLIAYLAKGNFRLDSLELKAAPEAIFGLSFGESPDVNELIADSAVAAAAQFPAAEMHMQWELARLLRQRGGVDRDRIHPIDFDCDRDYITSAEVSTRSSAIGAGQMGPQRISFVRPGMLHVV